MTDIELAIRKAATESYGRLVAFLSARSRDMAAAEDALSEAFIAALETWPRQGIPKLPEAWLLTAARRRLIDVIRHKQVHAAAAPELLALVNQARTIMNEGFDFPDERLKLLFVCAHPAIDVAMRTPLMLQTVMHLDAAQIASAFVIKPSAMGQRLTRAKAKIRNAHISFEVPEHDDLPARVDAVLQAIYAAYGRGWDDIAGADPRRKGLAVEAVELGRLMIRLMPKEPEAQGLLALMLHCEARRNARRSATGDYVPLSDQNTSLWTQSAIEEADELLAAAAQQEKMGRFQLEAAIQSVHSRRRQSGNTDWKAIIQLYDGLLRFAPNVGALIGRAAATAEALGPLAGLDRLREVPLETIESYQPYWALKFHLCRRLNQIQEAQLALERAIGLCDDQATRVFLSSQMP